MKKKIWFFAALTVLILAFTACGGNDTPTEPETSVGVNFLNATEKGVTLLRVRPDDSYDWSENVLQEDIWQVNYVVPVTLSGEASIMEEGWQVNMTFEDGSEETWSDVAMTDGTEITFGYENGVPSAEAATMPAYDGTDGEETDGLQPDEQAEN